MSATAGIPWVIFGPPTKQGSGKGACCCVRPPESSVLSALDVFSRWRTGGSNLFNTRNQDLRREGLTQPGADFQILVFVSHRWTQPDCPDASNSQVEAVCRYLEVVWQARSGEDAARKSLYSSVIFAWGALGRMGRTCPVSLARAAGGAQQPAADRSEDHSAFHLFLSQIGVWYDFCSLPQAPRTAEDERVFVRGLASLNDIIACSTTLAVNDAPDFFSRAWCMTEFSIASDCGVSCFCLFPVSEQTFRENFASGVEGGFAGIRSRLASGELRVTNGKDLTLVYSLLANACSRNSIRFSYRARSGLYTFVIACNIPAFAAFVAFMCPFGRCLLDALDGVPILIACLSVLESIYFSLVMRGRCLRTASCVAKWSGMVPVYMLSPTFRLIRGTCILIGGGSISVGVVELLFMVLSNVVLSVIPAIKQGTTVAVEFPYKSDPPDPSADYQRSTVWKILVFVYLSYSMLTIYIFRKFYILDRSEFRAIQAIADSQTALEEAQQNRNALEREFKA